jgi:hypothetical protein
MSKDRKQEWMLWFIGVALFSHFVGFFGISYFDQTRFSWYALLVIISVATGQRMAAAKLPRRLTEELDREPGEMVPAAAIAPLTLQNAIVRRTYS